MPQFNRRMKDHIAVDELGLIAFTDLRVEPLPPPCLIRQDRVDRHARHRGCGRGVDCHRAQGPGQRRNRWLDGARRCPRGHCRYAVPARLARTCLLYTSDAAADLLCVDLGGRRILKKNNTKRDA